MKSKYYTNGRPMISGVKFSKEKFKVTLTDGREIICSLDKFPEIKKLSLHERKNHGTLGGLGLCFKNSDEVYLISDFLGLNNTMGL